MGILYPINLGENRRNIFSSFLRGNENRWDLLGFEVAGEWDELSHNPGILQNTMEEGNSRIAWK